MIKIFVTGDNHIGKAYNRYPEIRSKLIESRFESMRDMIKEAENQGCGIFAVTGDLFDNVSTIKKSDVKEVVEILSKFSGTVLVLPGNHDYYTGDEKLWQDFEKENTSDNIVLLNKLEEYTFDVAGEEVVIYPAFCDKKHSEENKLGWIKEAEIPSDNKYRIGIAHGAIKGVTPDIKSEYFLMTEEELRNIPVDAWLIGHTHIQYPNNLSADEDKVGFKVFNAGTHEQTDLHNNTEGACFIITIDKSSDRTRVLAHKYISGRVRYHDLSLKLNAESDDCLKTGLEKLIKDLGDDSIFRITLSGTVTETEYKDRATIWKGILDRFLSYEINDSELSEKITVERIRNEYAETSFAAEFMERLVDNPTELSMAYELLQACKEA